jgi:hypothetical protein
LRFNVIDFLLKCPERMQQAKVAVQKLQEVERQLKAATPSEAEKEALAQAPSRRRHPRMLALLAPR